MPACVEPVHAHHSPAPDRPIRTYRIRLPSDVKDEVCVEPQYLTVVIIRAVPPPPSVSLEPGLHFEPTPEPTTWLAPRRHVAVTAPIPEPSTWALLILGFGAIGYAQRRQRRQTT